MKNIKNVKALTIAAAVALAPFTATAEVDFGKRGEAVSTSSSVISLITLNHGRVL